jgi:hypothetical protein
MTNTVTVVGGTNGSQYTGLVKDTGASYTGGGGAGGGPAPGNNLGGGANPSVGHFHSLSGASDVQPAWYALAFIMRVA